MPPVKRKPNNTSTAKITDLTRHIKILGKGKSKHGHRFTKLSVEGSEKHVVIRHDNFERNTIFKRINQHGADLITLKSQNELMNRIEAYPRTSSFEVAEEIGVFKDCFILPDRTIPALPDKVEICLNDIPADIISKYKTAGTPKGWKDLARYGVGNTRLMFAFALNFVGPVSAIWSREFVAFQFKADPSSGKGAIAAVSTSTWGWDPILGMKYGFGTNWNTTTNNLEVICKGYNHTILFLDETGVADDKDSMGKRVDFRKAIMRLDSQTVRGRMTDDGPRGVWNMPVLSTSNLSVLQMLKAGKFGNEKDDVPPRPYCDRLIDIPCPNVGYGMFEYVYDSKNNAKFSERLKQLASKHHGKAGREFVRRILEKRAKNAQEMLDFLDTRAADYEQKAEARIGPSGDLERIHNKFATVYAAGCLAIREKILPFEYEAVLEAILMCEEDHVRLVDEELAKAAEPQQPHIDVLRAYIQENSHDFIDLKTLPADHDYKRCPGYINVHGGRREYLFPNEKLQEIMGRVWKADELKRELHGEGLISTASMRKGKPLYVGRRVNRGQRTPYLVGIFAEIC
jgi:Domain of unknown function (DUF927)